MSPADTAEPMQLRRQDYSPGLSRGVVMIDELTCKTCGHQWTPSDPDLIRKAKVAAEVNGTGPFCELCRCLEMARRAAMARGHTSLGRAVKWWGLKQKESRTEGKTLVEVFAEEERKHEKRHD
jgi:hypothetical protein